MKKWLVCGMVIAAAAMLLFLSQTALDPDDYSGEWYSASEQCIYRFSEGIIYCQKYAFPISDASEISGAYYFCQDSVILFAAGVDGLDTVKELYLIENADESLLCEREDGSGRIYFVRDNRK